MLCLLQFPLQLPLNLLFLPVLSSCATFLGCCSTSASPTKHTLIGSKNWFLFHNFLLKRMPHVSCARVLLWFGSQGTFQLIGLIEFLAWKKSIQTFFGRKWGVMLAKMIEWLPVNMGQGSHQPPQKMSCRGHLLSPLLGESLTLRLLTLNLGWIRSLASWLYFQSLILTWFLFLLKMQKP